METLRVRCRSCGKELQGHSTKTYSCGCPNMTTICGDSITAVDLSAVIMLNSSIHSKDKSNVLSDQDILWQEQRRKRKVRKLDFEVR